MHTPEFRAAGHRLVDLLADYLETVETKPLFSSIEPRALASLFEEPLPQEPATLAAIIEELQAKVLPHCTQINHPGYLGLITPTPTPVGILGDFVASTLNQNASVWSCGPSATTVERQVLRWLTDLVGYGPQAGGNLTSGGSMATFIALKLARDWATGDRAQHEGITAPLAAYTSEERHVSVDKSADAIGIGRNGLRIIPTDDQFRIRVDLLTQAIAADRQRGIQPFAVVASGGSTNTGVIDPLDELHALCDRERLWLHVDAAYGGGMLLSRRHPGALAGLAYADSVTIDPHKWFFAPLDAGAVLVRDAERLTRSYGLRPQYLIDGAADGDERYNFYAHGFEQSRRFRALKVWMGMKRYGAAQIGAWVDANIDHVLRLYEHFSADPDFAVARRPVMSVICARYRGAGDLSDAQSARLHATVARRIEEGGQFWIGTTHLKGQWYFRVCPVNFRTRTEHMDQLYELLKTECASTALSIR
jgi:glutamate/tyrosine decarboxylase-like PLP-dependent enzyme